MSAKVKAGPVLRLGPCGVAQGCPRNCEAWGPHPTYADVWQTCWCGHSRGVHAVNLAPTPEPEPEPDVIQVVMLGVLRPAFEEWLTSRGLLLGQMPSNPDDLPTFIISPTEARMQET